jgi:hypothetical protein
MHPNDLRVHFSDDYKRWTEEISSVFVWADKFTLAEGSAVMADADSAGFATQNSLNGSFCEEPGPEHEDTRKELRSGLRERGHDHARATRPDVVRRETIAEGFALCANRCARYSELLWQPKAAFGALATQYRGN